MEKLFNKPFFYLEKKDKVYILHCMVRVKMGRYKIKFNHIETDNDRNNFDFKIQKGGGLKCGIQKLERPFKATENSELQVEVNINQDDLSKSSNPKVKGKAIIFYEDEEPNKNA
jgi:hypothetical protein